MKKFKQFYMSEPILMPKATAIWLLENSCLTFKQIADFCHLHLLEVQVLADGEINENIRGLDPVYNGQLTIDEIRRCEEDSNASLKIKSIPKELQKKKKITKKYTPLSKRQDKPDAIHFLLKQHPSLSVSQIAKLIGSTKTTIEAIRDKTHWKVGSMRIIDPIISGFCTQSELELALQKAAKLKEKEEITSMPDDIKLKNDDEFLNS